MRVPAFVVMLLMAGCGRSEMSLEVGPAALTAGPDAGAVDAGAPDAGQPELGMVDAGLWCAPSNERCLTDGWQYGVPGRCCNGRQTCKINGRYRFCEY